MAELDSTVEDAIFAVQKQRGGDGDEPVKRLWFDKEESWQYHEHHIYETINFLEEVNYEEAAAPDEERPKPKGERQAEMLAENDRGQVEPVEWREGLDK